MHMLKKPKKTRKKKSIDPCPICREELHLGDKFTQRIGLLDDFNEIIGWICPHCDSEFNDDNHLVKIKGSTGESGEA